MRCVDARERYAEQLGSWCGICQEISRVIASSARLIDKYYVIVASHSRASAAAHMKCPGCPPSCATLLAFTIERIRIFPITVLHHAVRSISGHAQCRSRAQCQRRQDCRPCRCERWHVRAAKRELSRRRDDLGGVVRAAKHCCRSLPCKCAEPILLSVTDACL